MKFGFDLSQPSTLRGLVWVIAGVVGGLMIWAGKDISQLMALAAAVAGGLGVVVKDQ